MICFQYFSIINLESRISSLLTITAYQRWTEAAWNSLSSTSQWGLAWTQCISWGQDWWLGIHGSTMDQPWIQPWGLCRSLWRVFWQTSRLLLHCSIARQRIDKCWNDLLWAAAEQVHFCFTKPVEQSLLSRLTEAICFIISCSCFSFLMFCRSSSIRPCENVRGTSFGTSRGLLSVLMRSRERHAKPAFALGLAGPCQCQVRSFVEVPLNFVLVQAPLALTSFDCRYALSLDQRMPYYALKCLLIGSRISLRHSRSRHRPFSSA